MLLAAACFGTASALQHRGANRVRRRFPLHPKLLADVARQPCGRWESRPLGLGAAAGAVFALSAALVKTWGEILAGSGLPALATSWELWTALSCGLLVFRCPTS